MSDEQHFERTHPVQQSLSDAFRAQNGEDRWLDDFFGHKRNGLFVEVGEVYSTTKLSPETRPLAR
ncbi:MAG: hypothetical protein ACTS6J_02390 [Burkholderiales bacterium]